MPLKIRQFESWEKHRPAAWLILNWWKRRDSQRHSGGGRAIVSILKQQEDGIPAKEICRQWQINLFSGSGRLPGKPMQSVYINVLIFCTEKRCSTSICFWPLIQAAAAAVRQLTKEWIMNTTIADFMRIKKHTDEKRRNQRIDSLLLCGKLHILTPIKK